MPRVATEGLEVVQVLVGIYRYQRQTLDEILNKEGRSRSEVVREALELWLRAHKLQEGVARGE